MKSDQKIEFYENESGGRFYIGNYAEMTFIKNTPNTITVNHTWVNPDHRGEGLAQLLYKDMVEHAKQNNLKVIPQCSFVDNMFTQQAQDQHLLTTSPRDD